MTMTYFLDSCGVKRIIIFVKFQINVLPEIVKQVKGRCEVYLDGGVTTGGDVFKALALGANMVIEQTRTVKCFAHDIICLSGFCWSTIAVGLEC